MNKPLSYSIKSTLAASILVLASSGAHAASEVGVSNSWDMEMNHIMQAGNSISASNQAGDKHSYTSNSDLDNAAWAHFGSWFTFMTHDKATTTISVASTDASAISPGFTVWRTDGEFDGGTGGTGESATTAKGTPHSFNQVGDAGDYGTWWMTDDSVAIIDPGTNGGVGFSAQGIVETMGYANDGKANSTNAWGDSLSNDGLQDGYAELTLTDLEAGWYLVFMGGTDGSLTGTGSLDLNLNVSSVPVPAAVYLFGTALVGLFASSRKKLAVSQG